MQDGLVGRGYRSGYGSVQTEPQLFSFRFRPQVRVRVSYSSEVVGCGGGVCGEGPSPAKKIFLKTIILIDSVSVVQPGLYCREIALILYCREIALAMLTPTPQTLGPTKKLC